MKICEQYSIFMDAESQHQWRGAGVYGDGQGEPYGCGVDMPHECRASVFQGEGGDAVADLLLNATASVQQQGGVYLVVCDLDCGFYFYKVKVEMP